MLALASLTCSLFQGQGEGLPWDTCSVTPAMCAALVVELRLPATIPHLTLFPGPARVWPRTKPSFGMQCCSSAWSGDSSWRRACCAHATPQKPHASSLCSGLRDCARYTYLQSVCTRFDGICFTNVSVFCLMQCGSSTRSCGGSWKRAGWQARPAATPPSAAPPAAATLCCAHRRMRSSQGRPTRLPAG